jgi:16S rRNA (guanine966-N2)-methyltransferase
VGEQRVRIIAGRLKGRIIKAPTGRDTRPTSDRVREAVFSAIAARAGQDLGGGTALDAFAGSGALGLEALSRGCSRAVFVELDRGALATIRGNIGAVGADDVSTVVAGDVFELARRRGIPHPPYSLLLLDPPYRLDPAAVASLLADLSSNGQVADGAIAMWEHASDDAALWPEGFSAVASKRYGTTQVDVGVYERGA